MANWVWAADISPTGGPWTGVRIGGLEVICPSTAGCGDQRAFWGPRVQGKGLPISVESQPEAGRQEVSTAGRMVQVGRCTQVARHWRQPSDKASRGKGQEQCCSHPSFSSGAVARPMVLHTGFLLAGLKRGLLGPERALCWGAGQPKQDSTVLPGLEPRHLDSHAPPIPPELMLLGAGGSGFAPKPARRLGPRSSLGHVAWHPRVGLG